MRAHHQSAECWGERGCFGPESLWLFQGREWQGRGMTEEAVLDLKNKLSDELRAEAYSSQSAECRALRQRAAAR